MKAYNSDITVEKFIARHAKPYDPAMDNYFREPFAKDTDDAGREWRILTYQEDDLPFRPAIRELEAHRWDADSPVLLRVAMPELVPLTHRIDLSFLGDLLRRVEGEPIDLRTDAVVTFHTEPVVWPATLQEHAARITDQLRVIAPKEFSHAAFKFYLNGQ